MDQPPIAPNPYDETDRKVQMPKTRLRQLFSEPLLHFLVAGILVFGGYRLFIADPEAEVDGQQIEISADDIRQIAVAWLAQGRSLPTPDQLQSLVDQKVAEEILFREGMALGLDRNDEIIKRRLAQKMDFLAADIAALQEPTKPELVEWFAKNSERFALPSRASFRQLYFSPDKRGNAAREDALSALGVIAGKPADAAEVAAVADPFILRTYYRDSTPDEIVKEFGPAFAAELFKLDPAGWRGPIHSGYGWHLVWIDQMEASRIPTFEEVVADVKSAWLDARYQEVKRAALEEMRSRYTVVVAPLDQIDLSDLRRPAGAGGAPSESISQ
ncbi:peptidylprolyl isomerase [Mesorhizobium sp.]|uniref:peptidylprolyl isomerase n=2 Tax=Mesorhizobium sp. TaxID=1871066 RepID=UPI000FE5080E|nr:peptidylprolyl isomerase [Mesorhizobium sp.]RWK39593.1 MAG: peptidyl-prolyl cis-trans isomerase [Mesorhizobium sp.]RWK67194.1 MAG: peptidyl-prolyl cis-trans isomerase [Mesorhizobium sp.]RWK78168.1 MAG: peptidyl-prolyl cis-trans isomerase [Mesorhizobium sp.]RWK80479.1 MAG: peptidyl-prolyl cis-trans isomerase [Mesorhizobium sp.]RWL02408.1 MAG: peptidyl-prolyl cis-trans isomerase [Mesorhizobium sp.]